MKKKNRNNAQIKVNFGKYHKTKRRLQRAGHGLT